MNPKQVRSLLAVVQHGSINKAAQYLHLAPSSISSQIKELNYELGVELFEPKGRNIILSSVGHTLLPSLQQFCAQEAHIKQLAQDELAGLSGTISLFAPSSMCIYRVPELIKQLQNHAPKLEVLLVHEPYDYEMALAQGDIDAAITVTETQKVAHSIAPFWDYQPLYEEDVIYVAHPEKHTKHPLTLAQLNAKNLITTEPECSYRNSAEQHFQQKGLTLAARQNFSNVEVIKRCVLANMGIGLLPRCVVAEELHRGLLLEQPVKGTPYTFQSLLIYRKHTHLSKNLATFLQALTPH